MRGYNLDGTIKSGYNLEGKRNPNTRWLVREAIGAIGGIGETPDDCMWVRKRDIHHYLAEKGTRILFHTMTQVLRNQERDKWVELRKLGRDTYARLTKRSLDYHNKLGAFKSPRELGWVPGPREGKYAFDKNGRARNMRMKWDFLEYMWHQFKRTGEPVPLIDIIRKIVKEREAKFRKTYPTQGIYQVEQRAKRQGWLKEFGKIQKIPGRNRIFLEPTEKLENYFNKFPPEPETWFSQ